MSSDSQAKSPEEAPWAGSRHSQRHYIADLTQTELKILQHFAVVALYRTPLRNKLKLENVLRFISSERQSILARVTGAFGQRDRQYEWLKGVPPLLHEAVSKLVTGWDCVKSSHVSDTPRLIPNVLRDIVAGALQTDILLYPAFYGAEDTESAMVRLCNREDISADANKFESYGCMMLLWALSQYMYDSDIWMESAGLPFSSVMSENLFDEEQDEQRQRFNLLILLLPWPNRNIIEVIFLVTLHMTTKLAPSLGIMSYYHELYTENVSEVLTSLHPTLPRTLRDNMMDLFRIPPEAETLLNDSTLLEYLSQGNISTKELLERCDSYMDMRVPGASRVFSSLHFTSSMWSQVTDVVMERVEGRKVGEDVDDDTDEKEESVGDSEEDELL